MGLKSHNQLPKEYLLTLLATLEPEHPWFAPGWTSRLQAEEEMVSNADGFYNNLRASRSRGGTQTARLGRAPIVLTAAQINKRAEKKAAKAASIATQIRQL